MGKITESIANNTAYQRATIKSNAIASLKNIKKIRRRSEFNDGYIEVLTMRAVSGGVEVFCRVWDKNGVQYGFGEKGDVDIERIRINNPPILVEDKDGDILVNKVVVEGEELVEVRYREDPREALLQALDRTMAIKGLKFTDKKIKKGKIGNSTDTTYATAGGDGSVGTGKKGWSTAHAQSSGDNKDDTGATPDVGYLAYTDGEYFIRRGFLPFSHGVPGDAEISGATLSVIFDSDPSGGDPNFSNEYYELIQTTEGDAEALALSDYSLVGTTKGADNGVAHPPALGTASDWTLNATAFGWILAATPVLLGLRITADLDNNPQSAGGSNTQAWRRWRSSNYSGTASDPVLVVEYTTANYIIAGVVTLNSVGVVGAILRCIRESDNVAITEQETVSGGVYQFDGLDTAETYHLAVEYEADSEQYNALSQWGITPEEEV